MRANLELGLAHIKEFEGGYVNDPDDPGGITKWGIAWNRIGRQLGLRKKDIANLTWEQASEIYDKHYFRKAGCNNWPTGIDIVVFDAAVNQGVKTSIRFLQRAVKVKADGIIGPMTRGAVHHYNATIEKRRHMLVWFCVWRTLHYTSLQKFWKYGNGWLRRSYAAMLVAADAMVKEEMT